MSGSVKTNIVQPHTLPEGSIYAPYEGIYQEKRVKPIMGAPFSRSSIHRRG